MKKNSLINQDKILDFHLKTIDKFSYLEKDFGFKREDLDLLHANYFPDATAEIRYTSKNLTVKVTWYFAGAVIDVIFVENENGKYPDKISFTKREGYNMALDLYSLVKTLYPEGMNQFILKELGSVTISAIKKRERLINDDIEAVLNNLALAVRKYAADILNGDTSKFSKVQKP